MIVFYITNHTKNYVIFLLYVWAAGSQLIALPFPLCGPECHCINVTLIKQTLLTSHTLQYSNAQINPHRGGHFSLALFRLTSGHNQ